MTVTLSTLDKIKPGDNPVIFANLSDNDYHGSIGLSSTQIKDAMQSLMYFDAKYNKQIIEKPDGAHFDVGRLLHAMVLEPKTVSERFIIKPDVPKPTVTQRISFDKWVKAGRPAKEVCDRYPTQITLERCEFWDEFNAKHQNAISDEQWKLAENMTNAIKTHPVVSSMLQHGDLQCETSYYRRDLESNLLIKARPDIKFGDSIADIKTIALRGTVDEDWLISTLRSEVIKRKYHLSAALYLDVTDCDEFIFIFVNKEPNYHWVAVLKLSDELVTAGRDLYQKTLINIANAYHNNCWPEPSSIAPDCDSNGNYLINII